jgi:hypothetical protein
MSAAFLGPLDSAGRVTAEQQTRVAAFLISAHGALARHLATALAVTSKEVWRGELNAQFYRESEIVSLLLHATSWVPDVGLLLLAPSWEAAWLITPLPGLADCTEAATIDLAALGHAIHAAIRPAALLSEGAQPQDAFVQALRRIEFESGRLVQSQILFLKSRELLPIRDAVSSAVERRHLQVRTLWRDMLEGIGVQCERAA